jgi:hypothetical protein
MRKPLWLIPVAILIVALGAPAAYAGSDTAAFTCQYCPGGPAAPETINNPVTFPGPTLDLQWDGMSFDITLPSVDGPGDGYGWSGYYLGGPDPTGEFSITDTNTDVTTNVYPSGGDTTSFVDGGLTFTPVPGVTTPEPSCVALTMLGVGFVLVMRKRLGYRLQQAS